MQENNRVFLKASITENLFGCIKYWIENRWDWSTVSREKLSWYETDLKSRVGEKNKNAAKVSYGNDHPKPTIQNHINWLIDL